MEETPIDIPKKLLYRLFIWACVSFRNNSILFWFTLVWGTCQTIFAALLSIPLPWTTNNPHIQGTFLEPILQNAPQILPYGICLLLWTALCSVASRLEVGFSDKELKRRYLKRMIREKEQFGIPGLPIDLAVQRVPLENIIIPLEFRLNEPLTDFPLTESELRYYEDRRSKGTITEEESRLLYSNSQSWLYPLNQRSITMADLWSSLTQREPVAIIQGFPGMGKSILLTYLLLYMARCNLRRFYKHKGTSKLRPKLIPIYIHLGEYVKAYTKVHAENPDNMLPLRTYLSDTLASLNITGIAKFIMNDCLRTGRCLVVLDGLEEVQSQDVQKAIVTFIREYSDTYENTRRFNRFLIASRLAPHSRTYFPMVEGIAEYPCYTIAALTTKQIEDLWALWYVADTSHDTPSSVNYLFRKKKLLGKDEVAARRARDFYKTSKQWLGDLTECPLLLTLTAIMQRRHMLPRQRIELFTTIARIRLAARNSAEGDATFSEAEVIQHLGNLALGMQERGARVAHRNEVMASLLNSLPTGELAENFLNHLRFQMGLFVQRAGEYFGFFHPAFQTYITARYLFEKIKHGDDSEVSELMVRIYQSDNLHEPLLLAASYKSDEDSTVSKKIIQSLLALHQPAQTGIMDPGLWVLLAVKCFLEAGALITDPNHHDPVLDKSIGEYLLQVYIETQKQQLSDPSKEVEELVILWLTNLPAEIHLAHPLLAVISDALRDTEHPMRQTAMLTLLTALIGHLSSCACASIVLNELIPLLLSLAGLPQIGRYQPAADLTGMIDPEVARLAQSILLLVGQQESAGISLTEMNQHFASKSNVPTASSGSAQSL